MLERQQALRAPDIAEGVHIAFARPQPAVEFDPELERALGLAQEFRLIEIERGVEQVDLRDRRLAHPDRADLVTFDQFDPVAGRNEAGQRRSRHPAGGAAAHDYNPVGLVSAHRMPLPQNRWPR